MGDSKRKEIPEVLERISSKDWLKKYGLAAQYLTFDQILPNLGFLQSTDYVKPLQREVPSQYGDGLFTQHHDSSGRIYNLCNATASSLVVVEEQLQNCLARLKSRFDWLNSESRSTFGVITENKIVIVADSCARDTEELSTFIEILTSVLKEQVAHMDEFNLIRCTEGMQKWKEDFMSCTDDNITDAISWIQQTQPQKTPFKTNIIEGLISALAHSEAQAIYVLANKEDTLRVFDAFQEKVTPSLIPVNIVAHNCESSEAINKYKALADASGGKLFMKRINSKKNPLISSFSSLNSLKSQSAVSQSTGMHSLSIGKSGRSRPQSAVSTVSTQVQSSSSFVSEDVALILEEIEHARNTLAEIQALSLEIGHARGDTYSIPKEEVNHDSLTSRQWLDIHGLTAKKLLYTDLVYSLAFHHCNGTVQIPVPRLKHEIQAVEMVPHTRVVHAQYCRDFVHVRLNGKDTFHVQMAPRKHKLYEQKLEDLCKKCTDRLAWLKDGSREIFGTLLEDKIVVVVDTSSSLKERLALIKEKVQQLIKEQVSQKKEFTIIHFNSAVHAWRTNLVPTSAHNLEAVAQWVDGLHTDGTTNTQSALEMSMSIMDAEGVYLLTDGRPDQPPEQILARVQQLPKIPVHTISFNCADSHANAFLAQLAKNTGGRYYYYCEDTADPDGPKSYKSEDMQLLEEEIDLAREQLQLAKHLLTECMLARKRKQSRSDIDRSSSSLSVLRRKSQTTGRNRKGKLMSSKKWLEKNSLKALGLHLMDAMGPVKSNSMRPASIPLPLAHVTSTARTTLIHPSGTNTSDYELKLDRQVSVLRNRLASLVWEAIDENTKNALALELDFDGDKMPEGHVYLKHRDKLRQAVARGGWQRSQEDFDLLEDQIKLADNFKLYLNALKDEVHRRIKKKSDSSESDEDSNWEMKGLVSFSTSSPPAPLVNTWLSTPTTGLTTQHLLTSSKRSSSKLSQNPQRPISRGTINSRFSKGQKVVARSVDDGFYYPGVVSKVVSSKQVQVELVDKHLLTVDQADVIFIGGAEPCPALNFEDAVLVRVRSHHGPHPNSTSGSCDYYIPGIVRGIPEDNRKGRASYSVIVFNGKAVNCPRRAIIKISTSKYIAVSKHIKEKLSQNGKHNDGYSSSSCSTATLSQISLNDGAQSKISSSSSVISHSQSSRRRNSTVATGSNSGSMSQSHYRHSRSLSQSSRSSLRTQNSQSVRESSKRQNKSSLPSTSDSHQLRKLNRVQEALLVQQSKELSALQTTNAMLEKELQERMKQFKRKRSLSSKNSVNSESSRQRDRQMNGCNETDYHNERASTTKEAPNPTSLLPAVASSGSWIAAYLPPPVANHQLPTNGILPANNAHYLDQAVNTDVWTEDRGIGTGPLMESKAVETEWSESILDSSTDTITQSTEAGSIKEVSLINLEQPSPPTSAKAPSTIAAPDDIVELENLHYEETDTMDPLLQEHVLARWPDDGWYYRGIVKQALGNMLYEVMDATLDSEAIHARDIIIDALDADHQLQVDQTVAALHPMYSCSYAPGIVRGVLKNGLHFTVELYDGTTTLLPRHDLYHLEPSKHHSDVQYLQQRESMWLGRAVIARRNRDGYYLPGRIVKLMGNSKFLIMRADESKEVQEIIHIFGELTRRRSFRKGDCALALAMPKYGVCMPATIEGRVNDKLLVKFCDGQMSLADPSQCFWLNSEYYKEAVEFLAMNVSSTSTLQSSVLSSYYGSESGVQPCSEYSAAASNI